jgi:hypothetical protein
MLHVVVEWVLGIWDLGNVAQVKRLGAGWQLGRRGASFLEVLELDQILRRLF